MPYNPHRHRRRSIRLKGHDHTQPGAYFVTICVRNRHLALSHISRQSVTLTRLG